MATTVAVTTFLRAAEQARDRWGETRPVAVAQHDLTPGDRLHGSTVEIRDLPTAVVSDAALETAPVGAVVRYPVAAGEPLVRDRFAPQGVSGVAALVPDGHRAVGLPSGQLSAPPLQVGDLVDVLVVLPSGGGPSPMQDHGHEDADGDSGWASESVEPAFPLVSEARVVDVNDQLVTVAVPTRDAPRLAYAVTSGVVALALTGT